MNVFDLLIDAIDKRQNTPICQFDEFCIMDRVKKHSQQGLVVFAKNKIGKQFAIKFYCPTDKDLHILKEGRKRFIHEVSILVTLCHKNIVRVYNAGSAIWNKKKVREWKCCKGFLANDVGDKDRILYYVMDFIKGHDISSMFPELKSGSVNIESHDSPSVEIRVRLFEDMIRQVLFAMDYYHRMCITHKDIKPDNIRYSEIDSTFVVVDFGFAHHFDSPPNSEILGLRTEFLDLQSIQENKYELNDMAQFAGYFLRY